MTRYCQIIYCTMGLSQYKNTRRTNNMTICQSCAMPLEKPEDFGTEATGPSKDYCSHCYQNGAFTDNSTMEEMIEICIPFCREHFESDEAARKELQTQFPTLKRWASA